MIKEQDNKMDVMVIGIAGGTGSGKTTLTKRLIKNFSGNVTVLKHDDYYFAHDDLTYDQRALLNYDHPDAFETMLMVEDIKKLKSGLGIDCPVYDYSNHNRSIKVRHIYPTKVIIVEGILIFENKKLCDLMDIKIYVDTDADVRLIRRIRRDVKERARSLDSVIDQYLSTVKPMHDQYVEPSKKNADIIVLEGGHNIVAMEMIVNRVQQHMNKN